MNYLGKVIGILLLSSFIFGPFPAGAQNMREPTPEERSWDQKVTGEIQKLLLEAASKMRQNWHNKMVDPKLTADFRRDVTSDPHIPLQLQCQLWLQFDPYSDESAKIVKERDEFDSKVEKLWAENNTSAVSALDNPYFRDEIVVDVIVNPGILFHYPYDTAKAPPANVAVKKKQGLQLYFVKSFPPNPDNWLKPVTMAYIGEPTVIFGKNGKSTYSTKLKVKSTDARVIKFEIHTSPALADEFVGNLDLKALAGIIDKY